MAISQAPLFAIKALIFTFIHIILLITYAKAQSLKGEFSERDIPQMSLTFQEDKLKFEKIYKGRSFNGEFTLKAIKPTESLLSSKKGYVIELRRGGPLPSLHFKGSTSCIVTDQKAYNEIQNWNPGNAWLGQLINTRGQILSVRDDHLSLSKQVISSVGGTPNDIAKRSDIKCDDDRDQIFVYEK